MTIWGKESLFVNKNSHYAEKHSPAQLHTIGWTYVNQPYET